MEQIIFYLFEYGMYLLCFYILYLLVFKGKSDHKFNRFYLISSNMICIILPLVQNSIFLAQPELFSAVLNPVEIAASGTSAMIHEVNQSMPFSSILGIIYLLITSLFLIRFLFGLFKINSFKKNGSVNLQDGYAIIESNEVITPFSFFKNIYLPKGKYNDEERDLILEHELSHVRFGHSIEKLFLLLNKVFFWWNPVSYKYFTELELIHEYQVDEKICKGTSKKHYGQFLLSQLNTSSQYTFVNNISSHIKNRIIMISSKNKKTPTSLKWGAYLAMFFSVMFLHACNIDSDQPMIEDNYKAPPPPPTNEINNENITTIEVIDTLTVFDYDTKKETVEITKRLENVYKMPEVMPIFGDCEKINDVDERYECSQNNLLKFIYTNLVYPEDARKNGIEGMAVVQFVIDDTGYVGSQKIVRSLDASTDKAVLSVLEKMNKSDTKWIAGRNGGENVRTMFTLPVKFKLEG